MYMVLPYSIKLWRRTFSCCTFRTELCRAEDVVEQCIAALAAEGDQHIAGITPVQLLVKYSFPVALGASSSCHSILPIIKLDHKTRFMVYDISHKRWTWKSRVIEIVVDMFRSRNLRDNENTYPYPTYSSPNYNTISVW